MYLYLSAVVEVSLSALLSILLSEPMFSFKIFSCGVTSISDFYTFLFNPSPNYEKTLICTQERVYPLQTMILGFYLFCVTFMLLLRPFVNDKCKSNIKNCSLAVYYALYAFPVLAMIHALAGGLIYFAFPYLSIIISCSFNAGHFAMKLDQSTKSLLLTSVTEFRNVIIIGEFTETLNSIVANDHNFTNLLYYLYYNYFQLEIGFYSFLASFQSRSIICSF